MIRRSSRLLAALAVVGVAIVASLVAGVGTGRASTSFTVVNTALIASGTGDPVPQVSLGGKIGFETTVTNTNSSNATHVEFAFQVPGGSFFDATDASCKALKGDSSTMMCIPLGGTMRSGQSWTVSFRFTAPTSGTSVTTLSGVSIAAQTQGNPLNNGTLAQAGNQITIALNADGSVNDTYLRGNENASAGGPQNFKATMPTALLGDPFGLELGIHNQTGTIANCPTCIGSFTELTIPSASNVTNPGNPFYNGTSSNPYSWTMTATTATSFKLLGVFHVPDGSTTPVQIPACAVLPGGGPTVTDPVCYDTLTGKNHAGVQTLTATGRGLENGKVAFG